MHASSSGSRKSTVPLICACIFAPPSSSAEVFCPIAACTSAGPASKQPASFRHQNVIAHHREISPARHAHSHNRRDLRNPLRAHHRVVPEHAPEIVGVWEHILLKWKKNPRGIHHVDRRNAILDRDILRANHFFRRHREKRARFHSRVVRDDHHLPAHTRPSPTIVPAAGAPPHSSYISYAA